MYDINVMRKIILLLIVFTMICGVVSAQEDKNINKTAMEDMVKSHKYYHDLCERASKNFRVDNQFSGYIRGKCILYESDRQRMLTSVFPITNASEKSYKEQMPVLMSKFAIDMNNREVESLKLVITEYCKYNKYRYEKRAPLACTDETVKKLFEP